MQEEDLRCSGSIHIFLQQVFVLLANTLLAPTRTNRVLPSGGRVLSIEELHLEPIATIAKMRKQVPESLLK